jgi:galactokinase
MAWEIDGVIGARMTGGEFGGCTVTPVADAAVGEFCNRIVRSYFQKIGNEPEIYVSKAAGGAFGAMKRRAARPSIALNSRRGIALA